MKNNKTIKNFLSVVLVISILFSVISSSCVISSADTNIWDGTVASAYNGGDGSQQNPFLISNGEQLARIANIVNTNSSSDVYANKHFKLTNDIYLNSSSENFEDWGEEAPDNIWTPIGNTSHRFCGKIDGDGHTIYGLYVKGSETGKDGYGLFGGISYSATIKNLNIFQSYIYGYFYVAGFAGYALGNIDFSNSTFNGVVKTKLDSASSNNSGAFLSAFVGQLDGTGTLNINSCVASGKMIAQRLCGGFVGDCVNASTTNIRNSYCTMSFGYETYPVANLGGFLGRYQKTTSSVNISKSHFSGKLPAVDCDWVCGTIYGINKATSSFSNVFYNQSSTTGATKVSTHNSDIVAKSATQFKDGTVVDLLNAVPKDATTDLWDFMQGTNYPVKYKAAENGKLVYLNNSYVKLTQQHSLKVAYLGGSITHGQGASNYDTTSWRGLTKQWLADEFDAQITATNAAYPGTGSYLGLFRYTKEVRNVNPDLIFVEFALNDKYDELTYSESLRTSESLVRTIYSDNPNADIVFVITHDKWGLEAENKAAYRDVAQRYGLMYIDLREAFISAKTEYLANNPTKTESDFFSWFYSDGTTHPRDDGYRICTDYITNYFAEDFPKEISYSTIKAHTLPDEQLSTENLITNPSMIYANQIDLSNSNGWTLATDDGFSYKGSIYGGRVKASEPGSTLTYTFKGTDFGLLYGMDANGGKISVQVDDNEPIILDSYRSSQKPTSTDFLWDGDDIQHTVTIELLSEKNASSSGNFFEIGAFLLNVGAQTDNKIIKNLGSIESNSKYPVKFKLFTDSSATISFYGSENLEQTISSKQFSNSGYVSIILDTTGFDVSSLYMVVEYQLDTLSKVSNVTLDINDPIQKTVNYDVNNSGDVDIVDLVRLENMSNTNDISIINILGDIDDDAYVATDNDILSEQVYILTH